MKFQTQIFRATRGTNLGWEPKGRSPWGASSINAAEDTGDPLEGLIEKTTNDPGAPFVPNVLERVAALTKEERATCRTRSLRQVLLTGPVESDPVQPCVMSVLSCATQTLAEALLAPTANDNASSCEAIRRRRSASTQLHNRIGRNRAYSNRGRSLNPARSPQRFLRGLTDA